ncbi:MAG: tannase/feruloyl esterase family alpha/beta hydrolase [Hyphomicrobiaceae bacterium]|nr:tannase/feruloyl esterase family alpha/beta hydrolase [Hyphomicrobiaceae bacterium]
MTPKIAAFSSAALFAVTATALAQSPTKPRALGADAAAACAALGKITIPPTEFDIPSGAASIDSATLVAASPLAIAEKGPTPAARVTPATPQHCRLIGRIAPLTANAPPIRFQINLPLAWNARSVQYGGGGFNGTLITATGLPPASRLDKPSPLAQGYVTYGTDSGHETKQGEPPAAFALNDEAFLNFAHAAYKKVRDVAVATMKRAYKSAPENLYFMGSSEGGREGLTMAQRYPDDFDGIFARVPVINWTALNHASARSGVITMGDAWLSPAHVKLVHDAVLAKCDATDGSPDKLIANPTACLKVADLAVLACKPSAAPDSCLNPKQLEAIKLFRSPYRFSFTLQNGMREYPGWGVSGEATPAFGPTGGWGAWWTGNNAPTEPPKPGQGIQWVYGNAGMKYVFARDPNLDVTKYSPDNHKKRVLEVSALMDSTNPDLSKFRARGGKLIVLEHMADYAQSPYAGINYFNAVNAKMGAASVNTFARLYTAPGVDHVGSGAPANVDMLDVLANWVENGAAPGTLEVVEQKLETGLPVARALPLCQWPLWPKYKSGDATKASSFECSK